MNAMPFPAHLLVRCPGHVWPMATLSRYLIDSNRLRPFSDRFVLALSPWPCSAYMYLCEDPDHSSYLVESIDLERRSSMGPSQKAAQAATGWAGASDRLVTKQLQVSAHRLRPVEIYTAPYCSQVVVGGGSTRAAAALGSGLGSHGVAQFSKDWE